jgi:hypothetical protein
MFMNYKKFFPVLFIFIFGGCVTAPEVKIFFVAPGIVQYFLPPTEWRAKNSPKMKVRLDITYRTGVETPPAINLSFINTKEHIGGVSAVSLTGNGVEYQLQEITVLYYNPEKHELRISSIGDRDTLADILAANDIAIRATVDGVEYIWTPAKNFFNQKDQFLAGIRY